MLKLMHLEWSKLKQLSIIGEVIIYWFILMFIPVLFLKVVTPFFAQSYASAIDLNLHIQMGLVLFGGSLIVQVFIDEYKNKTMSLSFGYPISRNKLFMAKVLFISLFVFLTTMISFILTGFSIYLLDQFFPLINGQPTTSDIIAYLQQMLIGSFIITLTSFIPLFIFGIWRRATIPTIICAIAVMNSPKIPAIFGWNENLFLAIMCLLGATSIYLSIKAAGSLGEI